MSIRPQAIVHLTTPPDVRCRILKDALELGFRRFILEKPMASTRDDIARMGILQRQHGVEILVVSNWTSSMLTEEIEARVRCRTDAQMAYVTARHLKSRISRTLSNNTHTSAFDVEMPHMVALACVLGGAQSKLVKERCWDLTVGDELVRGMGGAEVLLDLESGGHGHLYADHMAPVRERTVRVDLSDGSSIVGSYPCTSSDHYSQLHEYAPTGELISKHYFADDTLTRFFVGAYSYFLGQGERPRSGFEFNARICTLLDQARHWSVRGGDAVVNTEWGCRA
jgi:predicted dehydrogenase